MDAPIYLANTTHLIIPERPGSLLHPSASFLPLVGRGAELEGIDSFCNSGAPFRWLTVFGNGGVGKTRLTQEAAAKASADGWLAGFVPGDALDAWVSSPEFATFKPLQNTLMIIDNAARKSEVLENLIVHFAKWGREEGRSSGKRVRLILIERRAAVEAGWFGEMLHRLSGPEWEAVQSSMEMPLRLGFPGREDPDNTMVEILQESLDAWSDLCQKEAPRLPSLSRESLQALRLNTDRNPVYLQLAAIRACETGSAVNITDWDQGDLLQWAVARERAAVRGLCPKGSDPILVERAVAYLAFCGARDSKDDGFINLLRADALCLGASETAIDGTLMGLKATAGRGGVEDGRQLYIPIIHDLINGAFGVLVISEYRAQMEECIEVAIGVDPELVWLNLIRTTGDLSGIKGFELVNHWLDMVLSERPVEELIWVSRQTSLRNSNLAAFGISLHETLVLKLPQTPAYASVRADTMNRLAVANFELGNVGGALETARRAVEAYSKLVEDDPANYRRLANCLNNLAAFEAIQGKAVNAAKEGLRVVQIRTDLAKEEGGQEEAELAGAWTNLAAYQHHAGSYRPALEAAEEGVKQWEKLARSNPRVYVPGFVQALNNLAISHARLREWDEALAPAERAIGFLRGLSEKNPDAFDSELAAALANVTPVYGALGRASKAVPAAVEAVEIYERLSQRNADVWKDDLALALNNLAAELLRSGRREQGEKVANRSLSLYKSLLVDGRTRFAVPYATALNNLAALTDLNLAPEKALAAASRSAEIHEQLTSVRPKAFLERHAASLANLGRIMGEAGLVEKGISSVKLAISEFKKLVDANPDGYSLEFAAAHGQVAELYAISGDLAGGIEHLERALGIMRLPMSKRIGPSIPLFATIAKRYVELCEVAVKRPSFELLGHFDNLLDYHYKKRAR